MNGSYFLWYRSLSKSGERVRLLEWDVVLDLVTEPVSKVVQNLFKVGVGGEEHVSGMAVPRLGATQKISEYVDSEGSRLRARFPVDGGDAGCREESLHRLLDARRGTHLEVLVHHPVEASGVVIAYGRLRGIGRGASCSPLSRSIP